MAPLWKDGSSGGRRLTVRPAWLWTQRNGCCWLVADRPSNTLVYLTCYSWQCHLYTGYVCQIHSTEILLLFVGCFTSQLHASVSQGRICSIFACCHTEIEVADQTFYITQSQYTDTGPTSPSADPITPGAWQGSHWSAIFFKSLV